MVQDCFDAWSDCSGLTLERKMNSEEDLWDDGAPWSCSDSSCSGGANRGDIRFGMRAFSSGSLLVYGRGRPPGEGIYGDVLLNRSKRGARTASTAPSSSLRSDTRSNCRTCAPSPERK
jgi:hypothetical protein